MNEPSYLLLTPDQVPPSLDARHLPFKAVLVIEEAVSDEWQWLVSKWLVRNGCRYMMAWGCNCGSWDDSVDYANISEAPDELVMTTWHPDEPLAATFQFAINFAIHPDVPLDRTLIVHVSHEARPAELLLTYSEARAN